MKLNDEMTKLKNDLYVSDDVFDVICQNVSVPMRYMKEQGACPKSGSCPDLLLNLIFDLNVASNISELSGNIRVLMKSPRHRIFSMYYKIVHEHLVNNDNIEWSQFFADPITIKEEGNSKHIIGFGFGGFVSAKNSSEYKKIGSLMRSSTFAINRILPFSKVRGDMSLYGFMSAPDKYDMVNFCLLWLSDSVVISKGQLNEKSVLTSEFDDLAKLSNEDN